MGEGTERNKPCWCGSGKKYKKCHLDRETQAPIQLWEAQQRFKTHYDKGYCLAPEGMQGECGGRIVRAHTVSKSAGIEPIARAGHVFSFVPSLLELNKRGGRITPQLVGVNKVTTFSGFCGRHDKAIFAPLEDQPFSATPEQCFLLGYRALARELFTKRAQLNTHKADLRQADRGSPKAFQRGLQRMAALAQSGIEVGLADLESEKTLYDEMLVSRDHSALRSYVIWFQSSPEVLSSGGWSPGFSLSGQPLQDISDLSARIFPLQHNVFCHEKGGAAVFTWRSEADPIARQFVEELDRLDDRVVTNVLVHFLFGVCENLAISPTWWEGLTPSQQDSLVERFSLAISQHALPDPNCIPASTSGYGDWKVSSRAWVP